LSWRCKRSDIPYADDFPTRTNNILAKYIAKVLPQDQPRTVVDIGAGNGVRWSNSYALMLAGWKGLGVEADPEKYALLAKVYSKLPQAHASNSLVDPSNISSLLRDFEIVKNFGVLCLDIDGNDYWVLDALLSNFRPGLVVTEINENIPPPLRFVVKFDPDFQLRYIFTVTLSPPLKIFVRSTATAFWSWNITTPSWRRWS